MRLMIKLLAVWMAVVIQATASGENTMMGSTDWWVSPFWQGDTMNGESVLFVQETADGRPQASLLFPARQVLMVVEPATGTVMVEGKDYAVSADGTALTLPEGSRIPFFTRDAMYPEKGAPNSYPAKRDSDRYMLFGEGHFFQDHQVEVTYRHEPGLWQKRGGYVPQHAEKELPKVLAKLRSGNPVTVVLLGDSISTGANASGTVNSAPFMPPFGWLLARELRREYQCPVTFKNFSVGGKATGWGVEMAPDVAREKPDLAILAFGMNDASGKMERATYLANTQAEMAGIRKGNPDVEFILIATMTGNPEWSYTANDLYDAYREALLSLQGPGVAIADMTSVWEELLRHKRFTDITGNGVNHPNDFGHRCYAQVLLGLLR